MNVRVVAGPKGDWQTLFQCGFCFAENAVAGDMRGHEEECRKCGRHCSIPVAPVTQTDAPLPPYTIRSGRQGNSTVRFRCAACGESLVFPIGDAGTSQVCPSCEVGLVVPGKKEREAVERKRKQESNGAARQILEEQEALISSRKQEEIRRRLRDEHERAVQADRSNEKEDTHTRLSPGASPHVFTRAESLEKDRQAASVTHAASHGSAPREARQPTFSEGYAWTVGYLKALVVISLICAPLNLVTSFFVFAESKKLPVESRAELVAFGAYLVAIAVFTPAAVGIYVFVARMGDDLSRMATASERSNDLLQQLANTR
jgi:uncharacterized Zn finger protein (UPF0148 family)